MRNTLTKRAIDPKQSKVSTSVTVFAKLANNSIFRKTFRQAIDALAFIESTVENRCIGRGIVRRPVAMIWAKYESNNGIAVQPIELC